MMYLYLCTCVHRGKGGNVTSAGWQVTLCDPIWHVSSRSGVATLRTAIHLLLTDSACVHVYKAERLAACAEHQEAVTSSLSVNSSYGYVTSVASASASAAAAPPPAKAPPAQPKPTAPEPPTPHAPPQPKPPSTPCPHRVIEICNMCWTRSNSKDVVPKSLKANHCSKVGHPWVGVSYLILPCKKLLANLPPTIPRNLKFTICWDVGARKKRCQRSDCSFAHSEEEIAIWKWMVQNNGK